MDPAAAAATEYSSPSEGRAPASTPNLRKLTLEHDFEEVLEAVFDLSLDFLFGLLDDKRFRLMEKKVGGSLEVPMPKAL